MPARFEPGLGGAYFYFAARCATLRAFHFRAPATLPRRAGLSTTLASTLLIVAALLSAAGLGLLITALLALVRLRLVGFAWRVLVAGALIVIGGGLAVFSVGVYGYQALTREELAARITVRPTGAQRFSATLQFPDGRRATYEIAGDEVYVDASIIKWTPRANLLGLHTLYELDRIAGRYRSVEHERKGPRTVHSLSPDKPVDLVSLRNRYAALGWLMDAEYGSASYVPVSRPAELELRVSTTGLLLREVGNGVK